MAASDVVFFALLVLGFSTFSRRLGRWHVTAPIAFVAVGWAVGLVSDQPLSQESVRVLAEATLALVLFHDAAQVRPREIGAERQLVGRLLLVGLPLTIVVGFLAAQVLEPGLAWPYALLLAAALAPTDAGLGAATVLNPVVPVRVRRLLNVESGLNDGLATPVVLFAIAAAAGIVDGATPGVANSVVTALGDIGVGVVVGVAVGAAGGALLTLSRRRGWSSTTGRALGTLMLPVGAYATSVALDGNGFIAAFVAGTSYASVARWVGEEQSALGLTESGADLLGFAIWFVFGVIAADVVTTLSWQDVAYAALALTLLRMGPVALSLVGSGLRAPTVAFVGWFGPRGLASVVFALLAVEELPASTQLDAVATVIALTVLLSVLLHGLSADVLAERYGAWVTRTAPPVESAASVEPVSRSSRYGRRATSPDEAAGE
ncbi:MAG TPA: cation:proton antiporter [Jiangellales bacterium]|nr:cation:proton antiporter [Jiangellales bacterium]